MGNRDKSGGGESFGAYSLLPLVQKARFGVIISDPAQLWLQSCGNSGQSNKRGPYLSILALEPLGDTLMWMLRLAVSEKNLMSIIGKNVLSIILMDWKPIHIWLHVWSHMHMYITYVCEFGEEVSLDLTTRNINK